MTTLFMFPGQGSQKIGMGKDLFDRIPESRAVFEEVDHALNEKLSDLIFNGSIEELTLTANVQPALMAVSMAALRALEKETGQTINQLADAVVGHSLGEYSALCAIQSLSLSDTARILRARGTFMQNAAPVGTGAIAAIIGLEMPVLADICATVSTSQNFVQIANDNCPGQTVISGHKEAVEKACEKAKDAGARRAMILPVSAPVHSALMQPAKEKMEEFMRDITIKKPVLPLISNYSATAETDPETLRAHLLAQFTKPVRFTECITWATKKGFTTAFEIGSGKVLCGLVQRISENININGLGTTEDIHNFKK